MTVSFLLRVCNRVEGDFVAIWGESMEICGDLWVGEVTCVSENREVDYRKGE